MGGTHTGVSEFKIWQDDLNERQCYIRSFTVHDIYALHGETQETLINCETPDIS